MSGTNNHSITSYSKCTQGGFVDRKKYRLTLYNGKSILVLGKSRMSQTREASIKYEGRSIFLVKVTIFDVVFIISMMSCLAVVFPIILMIFSFSSVSSLSISSRAMFHVICLVMVGPLLFKLLTMVPTIRSSTFPVRCLAELLRVFLCKFNLTRTPLLFGISLNPLFATFSILVICLSSHAPLSLDQTFTRSSLS